jgi:RND family efflux transporter MFP subunit
VSRSANDEPGAPTPAAERAPARTGIVGWAIAVVLVCAVIGAIVVVRSRRVAAERRHLEHAQVAGPRVLVMPVEHAAETREVEFPASVHGYVETSIYAKIAGYLKTIDVDRGDRVKAGQLLAVIESPELDKQTADAEADYENKKLSDQRRQAIASTGALSREEIDTAHAEALKAKAVLDQDRSLQNYEHITAPVSGVVSARFVDPGALIPQATAASATGTPILTIATLHPVRVYADVPQNITPFVHDGAPAIITVTQYPTRRFEGTVTRHPDALATTTRTMLVEVDLQNDDEALKPGVYGTMHLRIPEQQVPRVPDDALVFRDGKVYAPLVRDGRLHLAAITLGYDNGREVEALDGVQADDMVALNLGQAVHDGDPVQAVPAQPQATASAENSAAGPSAHRAGSPESR